MSEKQSAAAEILDLIVAKAPALRKAGVTELELEGFSVKLAAHVADDGEGATTDDTTSTDDAAVGAFDDPALYGLPPGSAVPGFPALREKNRRAKGES